MTNASIKHKTPVLRAAALAALCLCGNAQAQTLDYLRGLLDATPMGGWVKASTNTLSAAVATGADGLPLASYTDQQSLVQAWSSVAWDSTRGNLMLWGGGHSSYRGNEMYIWQGDTGSWTRGSLPSQLTTYTGPGADTDGRTRLVVDDAAPQSAHTYEGNLYLPVNDMFVTLGGPTYQDANVFKVRDANGNLVTAGPWMFDPRKANANLVGGTTGSGYNPSTLGGEMWTNRGGQWATTPGLNSFISNTTAYRTENGKDVVYVSVRPGDWAELYRYTVGDVRGGTTADTWEKVGTSSYSQPTVESSGTIDDFHNLYIKTAFYPRTVGSTAGLDLTVWDLSKTGPSNKDVAISLVMADGSAFVVNDEFAINYSNADGKLWLWDGNDRGTVYRTEAEFNANGSIDTTWTVEKFLSTTAAQPDGNHRFGVLGKWQYVAELGAFVALDEFNPTTQDAAVWFYKPMISAVPEPGTVALMLAGLGLIGLHARRKTQG